MVAWGFDPDRQLDDPTLENMLLRIEEMQVSAACRILILTNRVSLEKVTCDRAGIYSKLCCGLVFSDAVLFMLFDLM